MRSLDIAAQSQLDALELEHMLQVCPLRHTVATPLTEDEFDCMLKSLADMDLEFCPERTPTTDASSLLPLAAVLPTRGLLAPVLNAPLEPAPVKPRLA